MLLVFLLLIALVVMLVGWASKRMLEMQERHQEQIAELTRQNTQLQNNAQNDAENPSPQRRNQKLIKKVSDSKKAGAYGKFEDEIQISREDEKQLGFSSNGGIIDAQAKESPIR